MGVAAQIEARKDVAPLVLAETLMGLDAVHAGRTRVFGGSPLLLQVRDLTQLSFFYFSHSFYLDTRFRLYLAPYLFSLFLTDVAM